MNSKNNISQPELFEYFTFSQSLNNSDFWIDTYPPQNFSTYNNFEMKMLISQYNETLPLLNESTVLKTEFKQDYFPFSIEN
jgi:hypothetical protein